jgi:hypothetical protein
MATTAEKSLHPDLIFLIFRVARKELTFKKQKGKHTHTLCPLTFFEKDIKQNSSVLRARQKLWRGVKFKLLN